MPHYEKVYNFDIEGNENYYVTEDGILVHNGYRENFFGENPSLKGDVVVHHAVDQQVLIKYPGLFTKAELDKIENLRGIPKDVNNTLHLSTIRIAWNRFYKQYPNATKQEIQDFADVIDNLYGSQFNPPLK